MSDDGVDWSADDDLADDIPEVPEVETNGEAGDETDDDPAVDTDRAKEIGAKAGKEAGKAGKYAASIAGTVAGTMLKTAKLVPMQSRLFKRLAVGGLKGYYKRSDADALGLEARANGELG